MSKVKEFRLKLLYLTRKLSRKINPEHDPWKLSIFEKVLFSFLNLIVTSEEIKTKMAWLSVHKKNKLIYPATGEIGEFVGVWGYLTGAGAREFPYYKTPSGIYFYRYVDLDNENEKIVVLDIEKIWESNAPALFFTAKSWISHTPVNPLTGEKRK